MTKTVYPQGFANTIVSVVLLAEGEWDERLWITLLDTASVHRDGKIVFRFKSGAEIIE